VQAAGEGPVELGVEPRVAVEDALELLHDDYAYEFQIGWGLWEIDVAEEASLATTAGPPQRLAQDDRVLSIAGSSAPAFTRSASVSAQDDKRWVRRQRLVRVTGFGPLFDDGSYEQEGHIRIDFGSDAPFLEEEAELDSNAARLMAENVRRLVDLTNGVEKASGATARLLWSELGESLAQRLSARLSKGN
jgi:hypothetical protein